MPRFSVDAPDPVAVTLVMLGEEDCSLVIPIFESLPPDVAAAVTLVMFGEEVKFFMPQLIIPSAVAVTYVMVGEEDWLNMP